MIKKVLIVDDSAMARNIIKRSIEICGLPDVTILEAANGLEALEVLKQETVDLVFSDLNMPDMDGEELLRRIKSSPKLFDTPVIIITSKKSAAGERKLIDEHAMAVLSKPISLPEMNQILQDNFDL